MKAPEPPGTMAMAPHHSLNHLDGWASMGIEDLQEVVDAWDEVATTPQAAAAAEVGETPVRASTFKLAIARANSKAARADLVEVRAAIMAMRSAAVAKQMAAIAALAVEHAKRANAYAKLMAKLMGSDAC